MMSFGSTGAVMPTAIMSSATVMNTKMNAGLPGVQERAAGIGEERYRARAQSSQGDGML